MTPSAPINGAAAYVGSGYGNGYQTTAYVEPDSEYVEGPPVYVGPSYTYGPAPYVGQRYGYGYGPAVRNRGYYSGLHRPMRLHCRHDRACPCPIGLVVASGGSVEAASPLEPI